MCLAIRIMKLNCSRIRFRGQVDKVAQMPFARHVGFTRTVWARGWLAVVLGLFAMPGPARSDTPSLQHKLTPQDHVMAVLQQKDAQSLWLLMARAAIAKLEIDSQPVPVDIDGAQRLIDRWNQTADYQTAARGGLAALGLPRDWNAAIAQRVAQFKEQYPEAIVLETNHYHILSTADPKTTQALATRMDAVFRLYDRLFNLEEKIPYKCTITFWRDRDQYMANGGMADTAAHYRPASKELIGYNTKSQAQTRHMDPYQIMFHEGWHQYFDFYIPGAPRWFDEGFAEVFATAQIRGPRARIRRNDYQARRASQLLREKKLFTLRRLFQLNHEQFMASADITYAQSYSFITFLMNFNHANRQLREVVGGFYKTYFWELRRGTDPVEAVEKVFGHVRLEALEEMWHKSVQRQK